VTAARGIGIRQCAVLVGGLGTRLGALTRSKPKPLLECGDRPFLAWLMRELVRFGVEEFVLLSGYLAEEVRAAVAPIAARLPRPVRIVISQEPEPCGTGGALLHAAKLLDERFLLCNGDSLLLANLVPLLAGAAAADESVMGHVLLREVADATRFGVVKLGEAGVITEFAERPAPGEAGLINAGIYLFDRRILGELAPKCSLERDILPRLATKGVLRGRPAEGFFIDIGIPEDLARAAHELPARLIRPALFLDRDGTINVDHGYVGARARFEWIAGAKAAVRRATEAGWHVFVVTNQSGVARGLYNEAAVASLHHWMCEEIRRDGGNIDDIRYCPYHTEATLDEYRRDSDWRKPAPGMLLDLIKVWELAPERCVLVGDQPTDIAAADAAGIASLLFTGDNLDKAVRQWSGARGEE
jgi:D-glycero-D-manno-heptose 1,7-bisphosphate phosphatase